MTSAHMAFPELFSPNWNPQEGENYHLKQRLALLDTSKKNNLWK
jgi:hypothetical protein